eukprot:s865_g4.t1
MALALAEEAGLEPQLACKLGPFSCFCLCVERGSLDAGAQLALAQAGVRGEGVTRRSKGSMDEYDFWPAAPPESDEQPLLEERPSEGKSEVAAGSRLQLEMQK